MEITSVNNDIVKEVAKLQQRKYRDESGLFLLEGEKCIDEAISYGIDIKYLFILKGYDKYKDFDKIETTEAVLSKISTTTSAPKVVAVGKCPNYKWKKSFKKVFLLENIKDAGNLGTIIRACAAFNVDAIILYGDTVDLYNPKCVRSAVGNLWKIPVISIKTFNELINVTEGYSYTATLPKSSKTIFLKDYLPQDKEIIMFGSEATGLSDELKTLSDNNLTVEMSGKTESLNLSVSVSIVAYKIFVKSYLS